MSDYLTVKEFAEQANISVQRVYQRLDRDLKPYLKTFKGKKYLSAEGLQLFIKEDSRAIQEHLNKSPLNDLKEDAETADNATIELLKETLKALQEQLKEKDKQLSEANAHITELTAALKTSQEQQTALTTALTQQQALHAGDIQRQLTEQRAEDQTQPEQEQQPEKELAEDPPRQKLSFFQRLFKRSKKQR